MSKQNSIGGIWKKKTRNGQEFLSISIDGKKYVAWVNDYKKEDKHPDFKVYADEKKEDNSTSDLPF